jgi:hypothetical protein
MSVVMALFNAVWSIAWSVSLLIEGRADQNDRHCEFVFSK